MTAPKLVDVPGVGPATASRLEAAGVKTVQQLVEADLDLLASFPGFHEQRAGVILAAAEALLEASAPTTALRFPETAAKKKDKKEAKAAVKKKKKKGGKKDKKRAKAATKKKKGKKKGGKKSKK